MVWGIENSECGAGRLENLDTQTICLVMGKCLPRNDKSTPGADPQRGAMLLLEIALVEFSAVFRGSAGVLFVLYFVLYKTLTNK